ncbi:MAG: triose-phosphate isomerase [Acidimicrobiaceae bacterium]|nr:triose-phosphate isomerase [Acidimicrobiaceae bacterium]|tara:strand:- start:60613 stop:61389 length:777 start_codon:yes stop_codon:yes gene_type:complete
MTERKPLISGNWKMHHNHFQAIQMVQSLSYQLNNDDYSYCDVSVHPPFTDLRSIQTVLESDNIPISLGAQHCHEQEKGAFTGEVSTGMLEKLNVKLVIVGHSERREIFNETDSQVNAKIKAIFKHGMTPILCVGETIDERDAGDAETKIKNQLIEGLQGIGKDRVGKMVIAYEPIWAIGTGATATPADAQEMCAHVRNCILEISGKSPSESIRIQYGGSVKPVNIADLMMQNDIDGALVGGAALEAESFARLVQYRLQ